MELAHYLSFTHRSQLQLAEALRAIGDTHAEEVDVFYLAQQLARQCDGHAERLLPFADRYGAEGPAEPDRPPREIFGGPRGGPLGLLRDLHDVYVMAAGVDMSWTLIAQGAQGARDADLIQVVRDCEEETATQMAWLRTRMKQAAPQALVVA